MRIQITAGGIYGSEGELPIGTELSVAKVPEGWAGRYVDLDAPDGEVKPDEDGDTPAMAEMRARFDAAYKQQGDALAEAKKSAEDLSAQVADLTQQLAAKDEEIAALKSAGGNPLDHDGDGKAGGAKPNDPPSERDELKKQAAELGLEFPANIKTEKLKELIDAKLAS